MSSKQVDVAEEYGPLLHTALRKLCDSPPTTYAWNVVHLIPRAWPGFATFVGERKPTDGQTLHAAYKAWRSDVPFNDLQAGDSFYAVQIFVYALEQFDEDDWEGFAGYLDEV